MKRYFNRDERESLIKIIINLFAIVVRIVSYLRLYCSCVQKILACETSHEAHILGFGVPNTKNLAYGTPATNAQSFALLTLRSEDRIKIRIYYY